MDIVKMARVILLTLLLVKLCMATCPSQCRSCDRNQADCKNASLQDVPQSFSENITTLNLASNNIVTLERSIFRGLIHLQILIMANNKISMMQSLSFQSLRNLITLDLSGNELQDINQRAFIGLDHLMTLSLTNNRIRSLDKSFNQLETLTSLNLAMNQLEEITDKDFHMLSDLKLLDLSHNKITKVHPNAFKHLKSLRYLVMSNNPLVNLPKMDFKRSMLQLADFTNCKLKSLPLGLPKTVRDLRFGNNKLTMVSEDAISNITMLRLITLNDNQIMKVHHRAFQHLEHLEEVWLTHNHMVYIPHMLPSNLKKLYMDFNRMEQIEGSLFKNDSMLELLSVESNVIVNISSDAFTNLSKLKQLNLRNNKIDSLYDGVFSNLSNLNILSLSNNPVKRISVNAFENLNNVTTLLMSNIMSEELDMPGNLLVAMPNLESITMINSIGLVHAIMDQIQMVPIMSQLQMLNMMYNNLQTLPEAFKDIFGKAKTFKLDGNPWHCDKHLLWFKEWMSFADKPFSETEELSCETPPNLYRTAIYKVKDEDLLTAKELVKEKPLLAKNVFEDDLISSDNPLTNGIHGELTDSKPVTERVPDKQLASTTTMEIVTTDPTTMPSSTKVVSTINEALAISTSGNTFTVRSIKHPLKKKRKNRKKNSHGKRKRRKNKKGKKGKKNRRQRRHKTKRRKRDHRNGRRRRKHKAASTNTLEVQPLIRI